jgi:TatD DNase family protein
MLIDTHAHLDDRRFNRDRDRVIERAKKEGITTIIHIGFDKESSLNACSMAEKYEDIYAAVGVHPHDAKDASDDVLELIYNLAKTKKKVVAVGEIGLDYYRDLSPRDVQKRVFSHQIALAKELDLPIVVHDRDAHGDVLKILKEERAGRVGGILHCFSGSREMAEECIKMGFYISFAGPITYSNARRLVEVARYVPLDRFLVETDCPYLTPEPYRGKRNEPAYVKLVAQKAAEIKGITFEELAKITTANAKEVFRI